MQLDQARRQPTGTNRPNPPREVCMLGSLGRPVPRKAVAACGQLASGSAHDFMRRAPTSSANSRVKKIGVSGCENLGQIWLYSPHAGERRISLR